MRAQTLIIAGIIIVAVLYFVRPGGAGVLGAGTRLRGPMAGSGSALVPGYRSEPPAGPATTSPSG